MPNIHCPHLYLIRIQRDLNSELIKSGALARSLSARSEWSGGAMVLGKRPAPGRPSNFWIIIRQGLTALAVGAAGVAWTFFLLSIMSLLSPFLWETVRYRLKYCLKGPSSPKLPTNNYISARSMMSKVFF